VGGGAQRLVRKSSTFGKVHSSEAGLKKRRSRKKRTQISEQLKNLQTEYLERSADYEALCREIGTQIGELLRAANIKLASNLEYRVKLWDSVAQKVVGKWTTAKSLADIHDLAGVRIVALFKRDVPVIQTLIEEHFVVLEREDTFARLDENQFGYGSIHYIVEPREAWAEVPTLRKMKGLRAEIQLRTGSQHIWAAASHALQYKREEHVPTPIRRSIHRVAALLETVDLEFERVLEERQAYGKSIEAEHSAAALDIDSIKSLFARLMPAENTDEIDDYARFLDQLNRSTKVKSISELETLIRRRLPQAMEVEAEYVEETGRELKAGRPILGIDLERANRGVYFTHVGLARNAMAFEFGDKWKGSAVIRLRQ
jgi:putative GTP pyrophosphokinase